MFSNTTMNPRGPDMATDLTDPARFEQAYDEHHRSVYAAAFRVLGNGAQAQDVVQDVFLRLWRRPRSFDASRGELGGYLRMVARSRAVDVWREAQAAGRATDRMKIVVADEEPRAEDRPSYVVERGETRDTVRDALGRLPLAQREALVLAYFGGLTADEVARRIHVPLGTAKSRIRLGLEKMRAEVEAPLRAAA
jgi:RNA polymerase sigma-70 factor (ECF subfamily)